MKRKFKLQNKILVVMLITCFIPFLSFSVYVYHNYAENLQRTTEQDAFDNVEKNDKLVFYNLWLTENTIKYITSDGDFCELMSKNCTDEEFSAYISKAVEGSQLIRGVAAFTEDGTYSWGYEPENDDRVEFALLNRHGAGGTSGIRWGGRKNGCMLVGTSIYAEKEQENAIGTMYLLISDEIFADILKDDEGIIFICDTSGNVIVSNCDEIGSGTNVWTCSTELHDFIYNKESGSCDVSLYGKEYLAVRYMSQFMDWYFVKLLDKAEYMRDVSFMRVASLLIGLTALAAIFLLYTFTIRKMFKPFNRINEAMRNAAANDFNVLLDIHTNDEFETIGEGFNKMVAEINTLLTDIKKGNDDRLRLEIEALQYQIDPHFLYNILAAVRFVALKNGSKETSDMLLKLNKLFRIKLKDAGKDSKLEDDMSVMMDYTELWNLRYDNKIRFFFDIAEETKEKTIPTLILQPIIENAIIHGAATRVIKDEPAIVRVKTEQNENALRLSVYDNGGGIDEKTKAELLDGSYTGKSGIGWSNVRKRLKYRCEGRASIEINTEPGSFTEVIINIYDA